MGQNQEEHVVRGVVQRVTFRNPENGYSVMRLAVPEMREELTVVGNCAGANVGAHLVVRGVYTEHPKFGRQLAARVITETAPVTPEGITKYLSSGLIPGVGEKTAARLVKKFGSATLDIIYKEPEKLASVRGLGRQKAQMIATAVGQQQDLRAIMQFLLEHNISPRLAGKIYERYKNQAVEVLTRDPYVLARDMRGVGFATADQIALNLGIEPSSPQRLKAGIYFALEKASEDGHCFLFQDALLERARNLLGVEQVLELDPFIQALVQDDYFVRSEEAIYLKHLFRAEEFVAHFVGARCAESSSPSIQPENLEISLTEAESELKLSFSAQQRHAVEEAISSRLLLITGGPGCGKTTVIRALTAVFERAGKKLALAAPTGRASQRMTQVTGMPACTIHRLLKYDPMRGGFFYGVNEPLPFDVLIVDEASMIDVMLAKDLLSAIPSKTTLILVGDKDQLPSVGPGRVFGDLLASPHVKSVCLSQLFRRSGTSSINGIAHLINAGSVPDIPQPDGVTKVDAYFIPRSDAEEAALMIEKLVADQIPKKFEIEASDICVLTPSNRGPLGTTVLNQRLQQCLNPLKDPGSSITLGSTEFRVGDRVCQRVNNYQIDDLGVFNGDIGYVASVDQEKRSLVVEMWDGRLIKYESGDLTQLSLAYAVTVHRSQGSEIPCVVLAIHDSQYVLLERQLLYTGVTRAKKLLIVVGSKRALAIASKRTSTRRRSSMLTKRIETACAG